MGVYTGLSIAGRFLVSCSVAPAIVAALVSGFVACAILIAARVYLDARPEVLLRDPAALLGVPVYSGFFSYVGIGLLCSTSAIALFVGSLVRHSRRLFLFVGGFSAWLAIDDLFLLHEAVGPALGVPELTFFAMDAVLVLVMLLLLFKHVDLQDGAGIAVALGALAISVLADLFVGDLILPFIDFTVPQVVIEDLFKLAGWAAWFTFWTCLSFRTVNPLIHQSGPVSAAP